MQPALFHQAPAKRAPSMRPYQAETVAKLYRALTPLCRRVLLVAPTGSGKTVMGLKAVIDSLLSRCQVLFVVDRDELVSQTIDTFEEALDVPIGVIKAGYPELRGAPVQVASRQTMERRPWWREWCEARPTVVIVDEAHETAFAKVIRDFIERFAPACLKTEKARVMIVGLTATPWRLSKREGLGDLFDAMVCAPTPADLIEMGYLVRPDYRGIAEVSLAGVGTNRRGDYEDADLDRVCNTPEAIASLHANWKKLAGAGARTILFAVNVAHARNCADYWRSQGDAAAHVEADTSRDDRRRLYAGLRDGTIPTIASVGVLIKGFDETAVECVILARPTMSVANHHQMIGRGLRTHRPCHACGRQVPVDQSPGVILCRCGAAQGPEHVATWPTRCLVLDQAGNVTRLGMPDMLLSYEMAKGTGGAPGPQPTKKCPECSRVVPISVMHCDALKGGCGYSWEVRQKPVAAGEMKVIRADDVKRSVYQRAAKEAFQKGWSPGYAREKYKRQYGVNPPPEYALLSVFPRASDDNCRMYSDYLRRVALAKSMEANRKGRVFDAKVWIREHFTAQFGRDIVWREAQPQAQKGAEGVASE